MHLRIYTLPYIYLDGLPAAYGHRVLAVQFPFILIKRTSARAETIIAVKAYKETVYNL